MAKIARHLVSKKKRRFQQEGYDLDMVFITNSLVAMGFPARGRESLYRNPASVVKRFFDERHPDHYKIYNLCVEPERQYEADLFHGRVACYPFADHMAPPFALLEEFCSDAKEWIGKDDKNIVVTHCKAGKGRTGVMICAYLLYSKQCATADEALDFYAEKRTHNNKGVTIPSQRRFIHYFARYMSIKTETPYSALSLAMTSVIIRNPPNFSQLRVVVKQTAPRPVLMFESDWAEFANLVIEDGVPSLTISFPPETVTGDVLIQLERKDGGKSKTLCHLWFNTFFEKDGLRAEQKEIDKAHKDKQNKVFPVGFAIEATFSASS